MLYVTCFHFLAKSNGQSLKYINYTLAGSVLNYSTENIGTVEAEDIEIVHTKFCRWILLVRKSTNLTGLYGELGKVPRKLE